MHNIQINGALIMIRKFIISFSIVFLALATDGKSSTKPNGKKAHLSKVSFDCETTCTPELAERACQEKVKKKGGSDAEQCLKKCELIKDDEEGKDRFSDKIKDFISVLLKGENVQYVKNLKRAFFENVSNHYEGKELPVDLVMNLKEMADSNTGKGSLYEAITEEWLVNHIDLASRQKKGKFSKPIGNELLKNLRVTSGTIKSSVDSALSASDDLSVINLLDYLFEATDDEEDAKKILIESFNQTTHNYGAYKELIKKLLSKKLKSHPKILKALGEEIGKLINELVRRSEYDNLINFLDITSEKIEISDESTLTAINTFFHESLKIEEGLDDEKSDGNKRMIISFHPSFIQHIKNLKIKQTEEQNFVVISGPSDSSLIETPLPSSAKNALLGWHFVKYRENISHYDLPANAFLLILAHTENKWSEFVGLIEPMRISYNKKNKKPKVTEGTAETTEKVKSFKVELLSERYLGGLKPETQKSFKAAINKAMPKKTTTVKKTSTH